MATVQGFELIIIVGIIAVILIFGSGKIRELAKNLGRAQGEFKKGREEAERELRAVQQEETQRQKLERAARDLGIEPAGKSDEQLKQEIEKALLR